MGCALEIVEVAADRAEFRAGGPAVVAVAVVEVLIVVIVVVAFTP